MTAQEILAQIPELECCSFSTRIPGMMKSMSRIFHVEKLPGLQEIPVHDDMAIETTRVLIHHGFPVEPGSGLNYVAVRRASAHGHGKPGVGSAW